LCRVEKINEKINEKIDEKINEKINEKNEVNTKRFMVKFWSISPKKMKSTRNVLWSNVGRFDRKK